MSFVQRFKSLFFTNEEPLDLGIKASSELAAFRAPQPPPLSSSPYSLEQYAKKSDLVYACIEKKASAVCDPELVVQRRSSNDDDWEDDPGHPLISLMSKPNPADDGDSFLKAWVASENLVDVFYAEVVKSRAGLPVELYPLHPGRVKEEYSSDSSGAYIKRIRYDLGAGKFVYYDPKELFIRRRHGYSSVFTNVSPLVAALGAADADIALNDYVRAFFNNGGIPSGVLKFKDRKLSDQEARKYQQSWVQRYGRGGGNRRGVAVLDANAEYMSIGSGLGDLDSETLRGQTETRVCMSFGVPPILIGAFIALKFVNQRASVKEAQEDFWRNTMHPELRSMRQFLTWNVLPDFEDLEDIKAKRVRVSWDFSKVEALRESEDSLHSRAGSDYNNGLITLNEARGLIGFDPADEGDIFKPAAPSSLTLNGLPSADPEKRAISLSDGTAGPKQLPGKKNVEIGGLTLSREPNELEEHLDLKGIFDDVEDHKKRLFAVFLRLRDRLVTQAEEFLSTSGTDPEEIADFTVNPPADDVRRAQGVVKSSILAGRSRVRTELELPPARETPDDSSAVSSITSVSVNQYSSEINRRIIDQVLLWVLQGVAAASISANIRQTIRGQSEKWIEDRAGSVANVGVQTGRREEIQDNEDEWGNLEYSALLDSNVCVECRPWDGVTATKLEDLPRTPNPKCLGGARCRCFIVTVRI